MLFTRCPHCDTIFRVTDEALAKAGGRVRCGRCANVFDAKSDLRESPTGPPIASGAAAPDVVAAAAGASAPAASDAASAANDAASAASDAASAANDPASAATDAASAANDAADVPGAAAATASASPPEAAENSADDARAAADNADNPDAARSAGADSRAAADSPSSISPAEIDDVLASMAEAQSRSAAPRFARARGRRSATWWRTGAVLALLLLGAQAVHYFRRDLAAAPLVGPPLARLYAAAGNPLPARWQAARYQPLDSSATESTSPGGAEIWTVQARFSNDAPFAQPYPLVRVEIKNRWEETLRRRDFTPDEYLARELPRGRLMQPREVAQASLELTDPGADATGFVFDVCVEIETNVLSCRNDEVFR